MARLMAAPINVQNKKRLSLPWRRPLLPHHQDHEAVRKNRGPWTRIVRRRRRPRSELRRHHENVVRLGVERQRARSLLGRHIFGHAELVFRFLFHDREHAVARHRRQKPDSVSGSNAVASTPSPMAGVARTFAAIRVDHRHHFVVAAHEQAAILAIDGKSARLGAGRQRPRRLHFQLVRIDGRQFALIFDVDEDLALWRRWPRTRACRPV